MPSVMSVSQASDSSVNSWLLKKIVITSGTAGFTNLVIVNSENLHRDARGVWTRLLQHFLCLVRGRVMGTREVAHVFVPSLLHQHSTYTEQVFYLNKIQFTLITKKYKEFLIWLGRIS